MKLTVLLENIIREEEDKKAISALDQAMGMSFKALGAELEANKDEIQQDVGQSKAELNEALGAIAIIGAILAAPKVVELLTKGLSAVIKAFKKIFKPKQAKTEEEQEGVAQTIVEFTHKWHKAYIKGIKGVLKVSGMFKKVGITDEAQQQKAAEIVYYVIIAIMAFHAGVGAYNAVQGAITGSAHGGSFSLAAFEAAMASVKTAEVVEFSAKLGIPVI